MKKIEVLGPGCAKCEKLMALTRDAVDELKLECELVKVKDIQVIMNYGVMMTPALVVDGEVKTIGKVPSLEEIKEIIK